MRAWGALAALAALGVSSAALAADDEPICADRPGKANPTCTVPPGMVQVETGLADWIGDSADGVRVDEVDFGATAVKFGLTGRLHFEFDLPAYIDVRSRTGAVHDDMSGFGDSGVAMKYRLTADSAPVQLALFPFVKLPTAGHALGNGKVEGGMALLADSTFGGSSVGWNIAPEADVVADSDGSGYHLAMVQALSIGVPLTGRLNVSGELWGSWDFDPAGTTRQFSADAAGAFLLTKDVQLDVGANFGLNSQTPDAEIYGGVAFRF